MDTEDPTPEPTRTVRTVEDVPAAALEIFLEVRPRTLLLSGGSTPRRLYEALARLEGYPWNEVEAFFGDERCVPPGDERSNAGMARGALLGAVAARSYPIDGTSCDADGYEQTLRERFGSALAFDLALYGLGPDGHTASLFPGRPEVAVRDRWVVRVPEAGCPPFVPRVSLTPPALSAARVGLLLVAGEEKRESLRRLLAGGPLPAAELRPTHLVILADRAASQAP
ncbi:MAG TPA: 6-phosphogluconolactonase [Actinomycetota bacterium]|nr:6-phosphogluconolactonase [Actinomycetota bacterium]